MKLQHRFVVNRIPVINCWIEKTFNTGDIFKIASTIEANNLNVILHTVRSSIPNIKNMELKILKKFNLKTVSIVVEHLNYEDYPLEHNLAAMYGRLKFQTPSQIMRKINTFVTSPKLEHNARGYIISVAGKIYGIRHMRKVFKGGLVKYTGNYLKNVTYSKYMPLETKTGTIGLKVKIIYKTSVMPGRFNINESYELSE